MWQLVVTEEAGTKGEAKRLAGGSRCMKNSRKESEASPSPSLGPGSRWEKAVGERRRYELSEKGQVWQEEERSGRGNARKRRGKKSRGGERRDPGMGVEASWRQEESRWLARY